MGTVRHDLAIRRHVRDYARIRLVHRPDLIAAAVEAALEAYDRGAGLSPLRAIAAGHDAAVAFYRANREPDHGPTTAA
jgi:hypothetical protein